MQLISNGLDPRKMTELPKDFNQTKIVPSEHGDYIVSNSEKVAMRSFHELEDAKIWRDHFFYGYYANCDIYLSVN